MSPSFDLIHERWIPCITPGGQTEELGLQDVLVNAHRLQEVYDESPLVTAALYRLLLTILHRIHCGSEDIGLPNC